VRTRMKFIVAAAIVVVTNPMVDVWMCPISW
jgi:hypothetical protein